MALLHIIPEAREGFEAWRNNSSHDTKHAHHAHHDHDHDHEHDHGHNDSKTNADSVHNHKFPVTEFVVCLGFLAVYLIDELLQACLGHKSHVNEDHGHSHSPQVIQCATNGQQANNTNSEPYTQISVFNQMEAGQSDAKQPQASSVSIGGIITVAALSLHSIFEGLFLGLQPTTAGTWLVSLAMAMHKLPIAFVLGFELCASGNKKGAVLVYITIFSIMSPIGAFLGSMVQSKFDENTLMVAILNGLAAGTLLFVTFFEVLQKQKNSSLHGLLQLTAVILGFSVMLGLGQLVKYLSDLAHEEHPIQASLNATFFDDLRHSQ